MQLSELFDSPIDCLLLTVAAYDTGYMKWDYRQLFINIHVTDLHNIFIFLIVWNGRNRSKISHMPV